MAMAAPETPSTPWHAAYPTPKSQQVESMTCDTLLEMIKNDESVVGRDYALVDLRRVDHEVCEDGFPYFHVPQTNNYSVLQL